MRNRNKILDLIETMEDTYEDFSYSDVYGYMKDNTDRSKLKGMLKDASYDIATLKKDYGLKLDSNAVWYEAFDDAPKRDVEYLRKMRKNGEKLNEEPRIT